MSDDWAQLSDEALFGEILERRSRDGSTNEDIGPLVGNLLERWRRPAFFVIRRIQKSYRRGGPDDDGELFQDAACKLLDRGLDQFRGVVAADEATHESARAASPKTFFLRIVKHTAIDFYRKRREELAHASVDGEEPETSQPEAEQATFRARRAAERDEAHELYWRAFERLRVEHPNEATAWRAYHHEDMDDHEVVAKTLGITVANSYKRISRAQAHLKLYLLELKSS